MSYQVLARKWRPRNFEEMIGQAPILRMLANSLTQKRIHHAYLFSGTRGVGKTTLGRIFAKSLNCEAGITPHPCGQCPACKAIDAGRFLDLYEVDAASRTKVEDTRELLENICYPPNQGRYKVYLIDEVHMLSNHSFNALLKTLEEPPEHVKFLLATTDPKRLPITILSRCLQFHLKRLPPEQITQHLQRICTAETIQYEEEALNKLAHAADGSVRDALSLLDQAAAYGCGTIAINDVCTMLGSLSQDDVLPLLQALAMQDGKQLFAAIYLLAERGPDYQQLLAEFISLLHELAVFQVVPGALHLSPQLQTLTTQLPPEDVQLYYQIALLGRRDLGYAPSPQQGFEMIMLRMLSFQPQTEDQQADQSMLQEMPFKPVQPQVVVQAEANEDLSNTAQVASVSTSDDIQGWRSILPQLKLTGLAQAIAENCTLIKLNDTQAQLALAAAHQPMLNKKLKERIGEALCRHFSRNIALDITITHEELITPTKQNFQEKTQLLANAKQTILQDPNLKKLIKIYDATVEISLIE